MTGIEKNRYIMKSGFRLFQGLKTDQEKGLPQPPLEKPYDREAKVIDLPKIGDSQLENILKNSGVHTCIKNRRSRRKYTSQPLSLEETAFLLWATQGVSRIFGKNYATFRTAPSGGARHPFETYLVVNRVGGLTPGVYRYLALSHKLLYLKEEKDFPAKVTEFTLGQKFAGEGAAVFIWSCIPYRGEWRYSTAAHKTMLLDAGHVCQNLYLAAEAVGCGVCAIAAYDQEAVDGFLGLDGVDEFTVYMAPVGKI